jgi:hypothetical protein
MTGRFEALLNARVASVAAGFACAWERLLYRARSISWRAENMMLNGCPFAAPFVLGIGVNLCRAHDRLRTLLKFRYQVLIET